MYQEIKIKESWEKLQNALDEMLILEEGNSKLDDLIGEANKVIFPYFNVKPSDKTYFISGSAMLYVYPGLVDYLNKITDEFDMQAEKIPSEPGDLDVVIPSKDNWSYLEDKVKGKVNSNNFNSNFKNGIFRPNELGLSDMDIEAFYEWAPHKAGGVYADAEVDDTKTILGRAKLINGYYFMSLYDVIAYKYQLGRDKEIRISKLIDSNLSKKSNRSKEQIFSIISRIINMNYKK